MSFDLIRSTDKEMNHHSSVESPHSSLKYIFILILSRSTTILLKAIDSTFPYFKKQSHLVSGYLHNVFLFLEYQPIFTEDVLRMMLQKLLVLDVHASREAIEAEEDKDEEEVFEMEELETTVADADANVDDRMALQVAETLDQCMCKLLQYVEKEYKQGEKSASSEKYFKMLVNMFDAVVLPAFNPHHVQFYMFYVCSCKVSFLDYFLSFLWAKVSNHSCAPVIRQSAICYMSSLLARSRFVPLSLLQNYLREFCTWAHQYIIQCDSSRFNSSLKAHRIFYSVCQTIFYVIAFRSRDLTSDKQSTYNIYSGNSFPAA